MPATYVQLSLDDLALPSDGFAVIPYLRRLTDGTGFTWAFLVHGQNKLVRAALVQFGLDNPGGDPHPDDPTWKFYALSTSAAVARPFTTGDPASPTDIEHYLVLEFDSLQAVDDAEVVIEKPASIFTVRSDVADDLKLTTTTPGVKGFVFDFDTWSFGFGPTDAPPQPSFRIDLKTPETFASGLLESRFIFTASFPSQSSGLAVALRRWVPWLDALRRRWVRSSATYSVGYWALQGPRLRAWTRLPARSSSAAGTWGSRPRSTTRMGSA